MYEAKKKSDGEMENLKCYFRKKAKFESIFLRDGGKRLKRLINNSSNSVTPWEIPKGGINDGETELECARREFCEEVNMDSNKYTLLWDVKPVIITHKDDNIIYRSIYYIAFFHNNTKWIPKVNFETSSQLSEVEQVQWVSLDEIKFLNLNESSKKKLINTYTKVIKIFKKKIKSYYYDS